MVQRQIAGKDALYLHLPYLRRCVFDFRESCWQATLCYSSRSDLAIHDCPDTDMVPSQQLYFPCLG